jgi:hypothetical protein
LEINYTDIFGKNWDKYLIVTSTGSNEIDSDDADNILTSSFENYNLALKRGLNSNIYELNGTELWNWSEVEIHNN